MPRPVMDPAFWRDRLHGDKARNHPYRAVYDVMPEHWGKIEDAHRRILAEHVTSGMTVLDVGCGYGRLLGMLPDQIRYFGVDLSPDFIDRARELWGEGPTHGFQVHDVREPIPPHWIDPRFPFDIAVCCSLRGMVRRECRNDVWDRMETNIRAVAGKILFLEYSSDDLGSLE